jgi:hypothetical protein
MVAHAVDLFVAPQNGDWAMSTVDGQGFFGVPPLGRSRFAAVFTLG